MSSKGRKAVEQDEFYPTPREAIVPLLETDLVQLPGGTWIEPCAGSGRIISTVNEYRNINWIACELNDRFDEQLRLVLRPGDELTPYGDFVHRIWPYMTAQVLLMNPPFSLTLQFVKAAFERAEYICCLQRTNWFGTKARAPWLREHCPDVYTLADRPSFRGDGSTDSIEYSWFVWPPGDRRRRVGRIGMLESPRAGQQDLFP